MAAGSGNSLLDYIRNGINNAIVSSPLNPLKPATDALGRAAGPEVTMANANAKMSAADQLAKLQHDGPPPNSHWSDWNDKMNSLKAQIAAQK